MKILTKKYPCKGVNSNGKDSLEIDWSKEEVVDNDNNPESEFSMGNQNVVKLANDISSRNERTKTLKAKILAGGKTGFINIIYLVS